jgi:RimJ/RimL family protein N-acetyltransferase
MHTTWTGERVRLRPFKDDTECLDLYEQDFLAANPFWGATWSPRQERKKDFESAGMLDFIEDSIFAIDRLDTGELVGYEICNAGSPRYLAGSVGTFILPGHEHHGFGLEAKQLCYCYLFENYPILSIDATTLANHKRAARGLYRSGMSFEGRVKAYHFADGVVHDMVWYRIMRDEWRQHPIRNVVQRG